MGTAWLISYLVSWVTLLLVVIVVVAMARQLGGIQMRLGAAGARMTNAGLGIGDAAPTFNAVDINGRGVTLGSNRSRKTLLVFVSPGCAVCAQLARGIRSIFRNERTTLELVIVSLDGSTERNREYVHQHKLAHVPYVISWELAFSYRVANPPYAILVDEAGRVRAKGMVNDQAHLESLLNAADLGHPSVESFIRADQGIAGP